MNFLLDICSAHMRRPTKLAHRFIQYTGQLALSTVTLAELYAGAYKHSQADRLVALIADLLQEDSPSEFAKAISFSICPKASPSRRRRSVSMW
jgi:tRNA(fMet)-specific endonuclease VapC